jgi:hypothetical protein
MQKECKCKSCGSETEPIYTIEAGFNGGFDPESIEYILEGYEDLCPICYSYEAKMQVVECPWIDDEEDELPF